MALASLPSFGSHFSSDSCLRFDSVSYCRMKSIYLGVGGFGCEGSPRFGCHVHVKDASFPVSLRHCRSNVSSVCKTQNNVVRCEMGHTVKEPLVGGESGVPTGPKLEVSPGSGKGNLSMGKELGASDMTTCLHHDNGNGSGDSSGGNGEFPPGGGGSGGGGDGDDNDRQGENDEHDDEFGPMLKFEEVMKETKARGVNLPPDMYEAAKTMGIQKIFLDNYLSLQELAWPLGAAIRWCPFLRNRMLADRQFLFKIGTEIVIDSCCATFAEVQKRGKDFWAEFELYAADLLVGVVVNIALVSLLAPYARIGQPSTSKGLFSRMARVCGALPSSVFEAERPGCRFSVQQRIGTYFYKGVLYGSVGFVCGIIGQGIANMIMTAKRSVNKSEDDIPVPPLVRSAALWGVFLAISSNARYQIVNGLERMVESSPVARRVPPVAMAFTVGVRFANNIYGGMQFVDWARWSGCQ